MAVKMWLAAILFLGFLAPVCMAQEAAPSAEELAKEQEAREAMAYTLLDQVISDAQSLSLPENRITAVTRAGGLLWKRDEVRARALFNETAAAVRDLFNSLDPRDQEYNNEYRSALNSRRDFLIVVSELDPKLAYDLMLATRPSEPAQTEQQGRFRGRFEPNSESELEMRLLAEVGASDPALALKSAQEMLGKGQFPNSLLRTLETIRRGDPRMAEKLSDSLIEKLTSETMLKGTDATNLALSMLRPGPIPPETKNQKSQPSTQENGAVQYLSESAYQKLLQNAVTAGLGYQAQNNSRGANNRRTGQRGPGGFQPAVPTEQDLAQANARRLYTSLSSLMPQIEKHLPNKAPLVKQKIAQSGDANQLQQRQMLAELNRMAREGTVDSILQAAGSAPPELQPRFYQQAAIKALNDGNPEMAEQIAGRFLSEPLRNQLNQAIERQKARKVALAGNLDQMRQSLQKLRSDEERVDMLTRLAVDASSRKDEKLAIELMSEARSLINKPVQNYRQMDARLKVARAYAVIDPAAGFEIIESGIARLNDLLPAAAALSGFEVRIFKQGELPLAGNSNLHRMINAFADELEALARQDFERARQASDMFQQTEPRIIARLSVIRGALGQQSGRALAAGGPSRNAGPRGRRP